MAKFKAIFEKMNNSAVDKFLMIISAFLCTFQVGFLLSLTAEYGAAWGFILTVFFCVNIVVLFSAKKFILKTMDDRFRRRVWFSVVTSYCFALTLVLGYELQYRLYTDPGVTGKVIIAFRALCLLSILFPIFYWVFYKLENITPIAFAKKGEVKKGKIFFISWVVIFVAYIPAFLAYYPMILSYDFHAQVLMAEGGFPDYWMHHPYLSTLMIAGFYFLGKVIGNISLGMALMGLTHMLLSSCAYAFLVSVVSGMIPKKWVPYVTTAFLALCPTNPVMVLCTTKDVVFSDFFIVFVCLGIVRFWFCLNDKKIIRILLDAAIFATGTMACLWRNNMVYAVVVAGLLLTVFVKKNYKAVMLILTILIFLGNKGGIAFLRDVVIHDQHGSTTIEMMSVFGQAYGRTVNYNADSLPEDVVATIDKYIPKEEWGDYIPALADGTKNKFGYRYYDNIEGKMGTFIKDWISIGIRYPDQYIDSFLDTTRGFWFIDDNSFAEVLGSGLEGNMGIIYTYYSSESWAVEEIPHNALWPAAYVFYEKLISRNDVLKIPVLSLLFKPAFYTLLTFFAAIFFLYKKDWKKLGFVTFPVMYIGTMFLGPVVQYRYVHPWIITFIPLIFLVFMNSDDIADKEE